VPFATLGAVRSWRRRTFEPAPHFSRRRRAAVAHSHRPEPLRSAIV